MCGSYGLVDTERFAREQTEENPQTTIKSTINLTYRSRIYNIFYSNVCIVLYILYFECLRNVLPCPNFRYSFFDSCIRLHGQLCMIDSQLGIVIFFFLFAIRFFVAYFIFNLLNYTSFFFSRRKLQNFTPATSGVHEGRWKHFILRNFLRGQKVKFWTLLPLPGYDSRVKISETFKIKKECNYTNNFLYSYVGSHVISINRRQLCKM